MHLLSLWLVRKGVLLGRWYLFAQQSFDISVKLVWGYLDTVWTLPEARQLVRVLILLQLASVGQHSLET